VSFESGTGSEAANRFAPFMISSFLEKLQGEKGNQNRVFLAFELFFQFSFWGFWLMVMNDDAIFFKIWRLI
jgi:hypothetical protein